MSGDRVRLTPPHSAAPHCARRRALAAECVATREEEQAVSTDTAGPRRLREKDRRPGRHNRHTPNRSEVGCGWSLDGRQVAESAGLMKYDC